MSLRWFAPTRISQPVMDDLTSMSTPELADEKARLDIRKLRLDLAANTSWRTKVIVTPLVSVLVPLVGILTFANTWYGSHSAERKQTVTDAYRRATEELNEQQASVRLSGASALRTLMATPANGILRRSFNRIIGRGDQNLTSFPAEEGMGILISRIAAEDDPEVLSQIANIAKEHPRESISALLSLNRGAAVHFARAAGDFSATFILASQHKTSLSDYDPAYRGTTAASVETITDITRRSGSPFEATDMRNATFPSRNFLTIANCAFYELYKNEQDLELGSAMQLAWSDKPPNTQALRASMERVAATAAVLEKSSFVLANVAEDARRRAEAPGAKASDQAPWNLLMRSARSDDLDGVAIVVGELDAETIAAVRRHGAFVQDQANLPNPGCVISPEYQHSK
jgi:hypothetical protein